MIDPVARRQKVVAHFVLYLLGHLLRRGGEGEERKSEIVGSRKKGEEDSRVIPLGCSGLMC